ncbi:hypothetical protein GCM10010124_05530 [Pilimelia terevasa]|uniref:DUF2017 domain-containing protein n=1 Tax=Pilimelia terevasa TaxID=53372 RepID=A0A8J3BN67_9ACTN|nr:DUF2017 domain-containing protein [Pilimelia terevasa]GGK15754.1 hypothetical protein GCM10010124_05530 [Pilimelia terevasa]
MSGEAVTVFRRDGDECVAVFAVDEVRVLRRVTSELVELLSGRPDHSDPVVRRLFPDAYPDRPDDAADYRRYTEGELKAAKLAHAGEVLAGLSGAEHRELRLDPDAADAWLRGLTDLRLALAVRLGIGADTDLAAEIDAAARESPTSPLAFQLSVYAYLGFLQESLLEALAG